MSSNLRLVYKLSGNAWIQDLLDKHGNDGAYTFIDKGVEHLKIKTDFFHEPFKSLSSSIFICNHHTGALDFLSTFPYLSRHFPNLKVVANKKIQKLYPLKEVILPVSTLSEGKNDYTTLIQIIRHLKNGGNVLIFPSGRVASYVNGTLEDDKWQEGCAGLIKQFSKFVVPVYVHAENNKLFYKIRKIFPKLSMLYLLRTLHKERGKKVYVYIGNPIESSTFKNSNNQTILDQLRKHVYQLKNKLNYV